MLICSAVLFGFLFAYLGYVWIGWPVATIYIYPAMASSIYLSIPTQLFPGEGKQRKQIYRSRK